MTRRSLAAGLLAAFGLLALPTGASADGFTSYRCADGTRFIVGFYPQDSRAFVQIDGGEVTLPRRLALSGARYSGAGVTLIVTKAGRTLLRHARRRATACEPF